MHLSCIYAIAVVVVQKLAGTCTGILLSDQKENGNQLHWQNSVSYRSWKRYEWSLKFQVVVVSYYGMGQ